MKGIEMIDVWDVATYDAELMAELECEAELICQYVKQDKENLRLRQLETHRGPLPDNPFAYAYLQFAERIIMPLMRERTIRGWHYTRLTDEEADLLRRDGIYPSTLATIKHRLDTLVAAGVLSADQADALYAGSPFHHREQMDARSNKFWMTAYPLPASDSGITDFLKNWGGEGVYFWQEGKNLESVVSGIGKPRVIELSVPVKVTNHAYGAAKAVLAYYGRSIGCEPDGAGFELYTTQPLGPEAVLAVHTAGDAPFEALARGYPVEFAQGAP